MKRLYALYLLGLTLSLSAPIRADHNLRTEDKPLFDSYNVISTALAKDLFNEATSESKNLVTLSKDWIAKASEQHPQVASVKKILEGAEAITQAKEEKEYRLRAGILSEGVVEFIRKDASLKAQWTLYYCPMASGYKYWVQPNSETKKMNPYMGTQMQQCGSKKPWTTLISRAF